MSAGAGHTRAELKALAEERLSDAMLLLENHRYSSAYYLAGYAVELALKTCIARAFKADTIPDKAFVQNLYVHEIPKLLNIADLKEQLDDAIKANASFWTNWITVSEWRVESRYTIISPERSLVMVAAVADETDGVMPWLRTYW